MTRAEAIAHNQKVVKNVINALVEFKLVDPFKMLTDHNYAINSIQNYIAAANIVRDMMRMPRLELYNINEEEE